MSRPTRALALGIGAAAVLSVTAVGSAGIDRLVYPRDEAGYRAYVDEYVPGWWSSGLKGVPERDKAWLEAHPDAVLAEGDAACRWLAEQPPVPELVTSGTATVGATAARYLDASQPVSAVDVHEWTRSGVVVGAWAYLCPATRETRTSPVSNEDD